MLMGRAVWSYFAPSATLNKNKNEIWTVDLRCVTKCIFDLNFFVEMIFLHKNNLS